MQGWFCQVSKVEGRGRTREFKVYETDWLGGRVLESKLGKEEGEGMSRVLNSVLVLESGSKNY